MPARWIPEDPTLDNYRALLGGEKISSDDAAADSSQYGRAIVNTALATVVTTAIVLAISVCAGYGFSRTEFKGSKQLLWIVLATMVIPIFTIVVALYKLMAELQLINTFAGLVLVYASSTAPLAIWLFYNYVRDLPPDPEEAALIDGCTRFGVFWRIVLPIARNGLFATAVFAFIYSWNEFLFALVMTRNEVMTYTVQISNYFGPQSTFWAKISAMSVLGMIPVMLLVAAMQRYLVRGLSLGAVKG